MSPERAAALDAAAHIGEAMVDAMAADDLATYNGIVQQALIEGTSAKDLIAWLACFGGNSLNRLRGQGFIGHEQVSADAVPDGFAFLTALHHDDEAALLALWQERDDRGRMQLLLSVAAIALSQISVAARTCDEPLQEYLAHAAQAHALRDTGGNG